MQYSQRMADGKSAQFPAVACNSINMMQISKRVCSDHWKNQHKIDTMDAQKNTWLFHRKHIKSDYKTYSRIILTRIFAKIFGPSCTLMDEGGIPTDDSGERSLESC